MIRWCIALVAVMFCRVAAGAVAEAEVGGADYGHAGYAGECESCGSARMPWSPQCCDRPRHHFVDYWAGYCEETLPCPSCGFAQGGLACPIACGLLRWKHEFLDQGCGCDECFQPAETECCEAAPCCETDSCGFSHLWDWFARFRGRFHGGDCDECHEGDVIHDAAPTPAEAEPPLDAELPRLEAGRTQPEEPPTAGTPYEINIPDYDSADVPPAPFELPAEDPST